MPYYVVYDRGTGRILQTHATFVLGSPEPVDTDEDELLTLAREEFGAEADLAVARAPADFDPRSRTQRLQVEPSSGTVSVERVERPELRRS